VSATVDRGQLAALRWLRGAFGHVQILALVEQRGVEGGGGEPPPSLASQQLALTIEAPTAQADLLSTGNVRHTPTANVPRRPIAG
jgi:hypothetical protein